MRLLVLFLLLFQLGLAQTVTPYVPIDTSNVQNKEVRRYFSSRTKSVIKDLNLAYPSSKKIIKEFGKSRKAMVEALTSGSYLIYEPSLENYLNNKLHQLAKANDIDTAPLRVFISRDTEPNAYSMGDGNFVFNIALLHRLNNEDELYYILSHELAHYHLEHFQKNIKAQKARLDSEDYKKRKEIWKKTKYNKFTTSIALYREFVYSDRSLQRKRELEADSAAYVYSKHFIRDPAHFISALETLDTIAPAEVFKIELEDLKNHFSTEKLPFQEQWLEGYDLSKYNYQRGKVDIFGVHNDSLKTHPEKQERVNQLKQYSKSFIPKALDQEDGLQAYKEQLAMEDVYAHLCRKEYGRGIYLILQLQAQDNLSKKQTLFYNEMMSVLYTHLQEARKVFEFKKHVDQANPQNHSEEYVIFLQILDRLPATQLTAIAEKYQSKTSQKPTNP